MKKRIMVVDDEPDTLELAKAVLEMNGFMVATFDSAESALKSLGKETPDLILLDMRMPQVSGSDFCKRVKNMPRLKGVRIVFFTASSNRDNSLLKSSGAMGYIFKPFDNEKLVEQVKKFLK